MRYHTLYHYTRGFPENIREGGLRRLDWNTYRFEVYENIPDMHKEHFKLLLEDTATIPQYDDRNGFIFLTTLPRDNSPLQFYYGGECTRRLIEFSFLEIRDVLFEILETIGVPLRVTVKIPEESLSLSQVSKFQEIANGTFSGGEHTDIWLDYDIPPHWIQDIQVIRN